MSHCYICSHLGIHVLHARCPTDPCSCVDVILAQIMKLNVVQAAIALRLENWALDQEIAGFNPKISSEIRAGKLNKSKAAVRNPLRKVLLTLCCLVTSTRGQWLCWSEPVCNRIWVKQSAAGTPQQADRATIFRVNRGWRKVDSPILYADLLPDKADRWQTRIWMFLLCLDRSVRPLWTDIPPARGERKRVLSWV